MENSIKIVLALLFFLCLLSLPYGFYELVRFLALIGFAALAIYAKKEGREKEMFIYIALAILFQPLFKISLGRVLWNIIDVIVGIGLLISIRKNKF